MRYEWGSVLGITALSAVSFSLCPAEVGAHVGWFCLLSGFICLIGIVLSSGLQARKHSIVSLADARELILNHRMYVAVMTAFTLVGVTGIEVAVRKVGGRWGEPHLVLFHLCLVLCMVVCFIQARFFATGLKDPLKHRFAVYGLMLFYLGALVTGTTLVNERFPLRVPEFLLGFG